MLLVRRMGANNVRGGGAPRYVLPLDAKPSRELWKIIEYHDNTWG